MPDAVGPPSAWVRRFLRYIPAAGPVLDVAAGGGRHTLDRDVTGLADLAGRAGLEVIQADLEAGGPWPLGDRRFAGVIVTNYLHRPLLPAIVAAVATDGCLIYETFAAGNERFGRPRNPDFLLRPGELLDAVHGRLGVIAYENLEVTEPCPAVVQRIAALNVFDAAAVTISGVD
jgi:hypothetical protein